MRKTWILVGLLLGGTAFAADFTGTWKLNEKKSDPIPNVVTETMTLERTGPNAYPILAEQELLDPAFKINSGRDSMSASVCWRQFRLRLGNKSPMRIDG